MKNILFLTAFLLVTSASIAQQVANVNFDFIKEKVTDSTSTYYYPLLEQRLIELDTTLDSDMYELLYYGHVFSEKYDPYGQPEDMDTFRTMIRDGRYNEALPIGWKMFREDPVNLDLCFKMLVCYHRLDMKDSARLFARPYFSFLNVIYNSGDGKSIRTAYVVTCVSDEYEVMADMELELKRQSLLMDGPCDKMDVKPASSDTPKEYRKIKTLYFDVSKPFEHMSKMFNESK